MTDVIIGEIEVGLSCNPLIVQVIGNGELVLRRSDHCTALQEEDAVELAKFLMEHYVR